MKNLAISVLALVVVAALSFFYGARFEKRRQIPVTIERCDTLYIRDTVSVSTPVYLFCRVVDTLFVPVVDTLRLHDTTYVKLEREQKVYGDKYYYTAWVSGYKPELDSIQIYMDKEIITRFIQEPAKKVGRWGVGITAGYGVTPTGLAPYVGAGITYNLVRW